MSWRQLVGAHTKDALSGGSAPTLHPHPRLLHSRFGAYVRLADGEEVPLRRVVRRFIDGCVACTASDRILISDKNTCPQSTHAGKHVGVEESAPPRDLATHSLSFGKVFCPFPSVRLLSASDERAADGSGGSVFTGPSTRDARPRVELHLLPRFGGEGTAPNPFMQSQEEHSCVAVLRLSELCAVVPSTCEVWALVYGPIEGLSASLLRGKKGRRPKKFTSAAQQAATIEGSSHEKAPKGGERGHEPAAVAVEKKGARKAAPKKAPKGAKKTKRKAPPARRKWAPMGWGGPLPPSSSSDAEEAELEPSDSIASNDEDPPGLENCDEHHEAEKHNLQPSVENNENYCAAATAIIKEACSEITRDVFEAHHCQSLFATVQTLGIAIAERFRLAGLPLAAVSLPPRLTCRVYSPPPPEEAALAKAQSRQLSTIESLLASQEEHLSRGRERREIGPAAALALIRPSLPHLARHLRPYQTDAIARALLLDGSTAFKAVGSGNAHNHAHATRRLGRVLLADEMGLGKTLQAIGIVAALAGLHARTSSAIGGTDLSANDDGKRGEDSETSSFHADSGGEYTNYSAGSHTVPSPFPVLIVCPASVRPMWAAEAERWLAGTLPPVGACESSTADSGAAQQRRNREEDTAEAEGVEQEEGGASPSQFVWSITGHDAKIGARRTPPVVVISRQLAGVLFEVDLATRRWGTVIIDESHQLHTSLLAHAPSATVPPMPSQHGGGADVISGDPTTHAHAEDSAASGACRTTLCALRLCRAAPYALMLSGTPSLSTPFDLFMQLAGLRPDLFAARGGRMDSDGGTDSFQASPTSELEARHASCPVPRWGPLEAEAVTKEDFGFAFTEALVGHGGGGFLRFGRCERLAELRGVLESAFWIRREKKDVEGSVVNVTVVNTCSTDSEALNVHKVASETVDASRRLHKATEGVDASNSNGGTFAAPKVHRVVVCISGDERIAGGGDDRAKKRTRSPSIDGSPEGPRGEEEDLSDDEGEVDGTEGVEAPPTADEVTNISTSTVATGLTAGAGEITPYHAAGLAKTRALRPLIRRLVRETLIDDARRSEEEKGETYADGGSGVASSRPRAKKTLVLFAHHIAVLDAVQHAATAAVAAVIEESLRSEEGRGRPARASSDIVRRIDGSTPMPAREMMLNQFADSGHSVRVLVAAVTACGVGVHQMAGAAAAVFCELPPNVAWLLQAEGRVARPRSGGGGSSSPLPLCKVYVCVATNLRFDRRLWGRLQRGFEDVATVMASAGDRSQTPAAPQHQCGGASSSALLTRAKSMAEIRPFPPTATLSCCVGLCIAHLDHAAQRASELMYGTESEEGLAGRFGRLSFGFGFRVAQFTEHVQIIARLPANDEPSARSTSANFDERSFAVSTAGDMYTLLVSYPRALCSEMVTFAEPCAVPPAAAAILTELRLFLVLIGASPLLASADDGPSDDRRLSLRPMSAHEARQRRLSGTVAWAPIGVASEPKANPLRAAPPSSDSATRTARSHAQGLTQTPSLAESVGMLTVSRPWGAPPPASHASPSAVVGAWGGQESVLFRELPSHDAESSQSMPARPPRYAPPLSPDPDTQSIPLPAHGLAPIGCVFVVVSVPVTVAGERLETKHIAAAELMEPSPCESKRCYRLRCLQCRRGPPLPLLSAFAVGVNAASVRSVRLADGESFAPSASFEHLTADDSANADSRSMHTVRWEDIAPRTTAEASSPYLYLFCTGACKAAYFIVRSGTAVRRALGAHDGGVCNRCMLDGGALLAELQSVGPLEPIGSGGGESATEARRAKIICLRQPEFARPEHAALLRRLARNPTAGNVWHADHCTPVRAGGGMAGLSNLQTLCVVCHAAKTRLEGRRYAPTTRK